MKEKKLDRTQLILDPDQSVFHLKLKAGDIAPTVLLVGDPGRVDQVKHFFDSILLEKQNREFHTCTGTYRGMPVSVMSTGIGTDNIDIVVHELDLLVNYDADNGRYKEENHSLRLVRIGTSGSVQEDLPPGSFLLSSHAIGTDGLMYYYRPAQEMDDGTFSESFTKSTRWPHELALPYLVEADPELLSLLKTGQTQEGITLSANGFYGPQGRSLRLPVRMPDLAKRLANFRFRGMRITNFEMETSALFGLSRMLGHRAATVCTIIANRATGEFLTDYKPAVDKLIEYSLDRLFATAEP